jgi:GMP synthase (glutamine-hydrolysing)
MHALLHSHAVVPASERPVLLVLHQELSTAGRVGHYLAARGLPLDIRRPRFGDPLPDTLAEHAGAVIFGGPQSANDADDFVRREIDWIAVPLKEKKPFLASASAPRCWRSTSARASPFIRRARPRSATTRSG